MASQWNDHHHQPFLSDFNLSDDHVTQQPHSNSEPTADHNGGLVFMQSSSAANQGGGLVSAMDLNHQPMQMTGLELFTTSHLVSKANQMVNSDTNKHDEMVVSMEHHDESSDKNEFDPSALCSLISSDESISMHPGQSDLEVNDYGNLSDSELPPNFLQSLGSALALPITEDFHTSSVSSLHHQPISVSQLLHQNVQQQQHQQLHLQQQHHLRLQHHPQHQHHQLGQQLQQNHQHQHQQQHLQHSGGILANTNHNHHQQQQHSHHDSNPSSPDLMIPPSISFDMSDHPHSISDSTILPSLYLPLHERGSLSVKPLSAGAIDQPRASQHGQQLSSTGCHGNIPQSNLTLGHDFQSVLPHNPKLNSLVIDGVNDRTNRLSGRSMNGHLPFHVSSSSHVISTHEGSTAKDDQSQLIVQSNQGIDTAKTAAANGMIGVGVDTNQILEGKAKKCKLVKTAVGDKIWIHNKNKSVESKRKDREASQALIEIVTQQRWQEKLQNPSIKKKILWDGIGQEFVSKGYFLENPGKKCFQKWRNLERSFRDYELNKRAQPSTTKSLPDFYHDLYPVLIGKVSVDLEAEEEKIRTEDKKLIEKCVNLDANVDSQPSNEEGVDEGQPSQLDLKCSDRSSRHDTATACLKTPADDTNEDLGCQSVAPNQQHHLHKDSSHFVSKPKCMPKPSVRTVVRRSAGRLKGKNERRMSVWRRPSFDQTLMLSIAEGLQSQQHHLAQISSSLLSIKQMMEEQKAEKSSRVTESRSHIAEIKSILDRNQREKMSFMNDFLKSVTKTLKNGHNNHH